MPWWAGLPSETLRDLKARHPDLEAAAVEAVRHSRYAGELAQLGAEIVSTPEVDHIGSVRQPHEPAEYVWFAPRDAADGRELLAAALLAGEAEDEREEYGPWPKVKAEKAAKLRIETHRGRSWIGEQVGWSERQVGYVIDLLERTPPALIWDDEHGLLPGTLWDIKGVPGGRSIMVQRVGTT
jgi:hypothetical protein